MTGAGRAQHAGERVGVGSPAAVMADVVAVLLLAAAAASGVVVHALGAWLLAGVVGAMLVVLVGRLLAGVLVPGRHGTARRGGSKGLGPAGRRP